MQNDGPHGHKCIRIPSILLLWMMCGTSTSASVRVQVAPENLRPDPFGGIVAADNRSGAKLLSKFEVQSARAAYVSCHLVVSIPERGSYRLAVSSPDKSLEPELFREWFHPVSGQYVPDALVPVSEPVNGQIPDLDNRIPAQTASAFWLDIWVSAKASPGPHILTATVTGGNHEIARLPITVNVLPAMIPDQDTVTIDGNSYGTSWIPQQYPRLARQVGDQFPNSPEFFALIHAYYRMFFAHRSTFHQLGYGHAGKVAPEFAPSLAGTGANKHIVDWTLYDRHFGPLLDGSAFSGMRRPAAPIPNVYLPINPEWPASFEWWGEPGYKREFVNVVSEMEQHFHQRGWTGTSFELFFNHKKRYKGFAWDGDEARFPKDYQYLRVYADLLRDALPRNSPVKFVFRTDSSWTMERQWKELSGTINFWVCSENILSWHRGWPQKLRARGDVVWSYGSTPSLLEPSSHVTLDVLRPWMQRVQGFVRWLVTSPDPDPWFHSKEETEALVYSGDRFGIAGPIPSIRLKLQRNAVQEITLLNSLTATSTDPERLRRAAVYAFNRTQVDDWWIKKPAIADVDPVNWSNAEVDNASRWPAEFGASLDVEAFERVRAMILNDARARDVQHER